MKIIYDTDESKEKRLCMIDNDGTPYYGFRCFQKQRKTMVEKATRGGAL